MANAKKCDVCGTLYESGPPGDTFHPKDSDPVSVVIVSFKTGRDEIDLCPVCVYSYLTRMRAKLEKTAMIALKFRYTEIGHCQVHYTCKNEDDLAVYYCLMEEGNDSVRLYRCSKEGEAVYSVKLAPGAEIEFETPFDNYGQELLTQFLKENGL